MQSIFRSLFVTIATPSLATCTSLYSTPLLLQAGASFSASIGRDALEMSISPAQNFSKPPPVPDSPTEMFTSGFLAWNCSAAACANGNTVEEPSILIAPDSFASPDEPEVSLPLLSPPHAPTPKASVALSTTPEIRRMVLTLPP